jgi:poly-D-alanine transfer protein DltD
MKETYILSPNYGDMSTVILGSDVKSIKESFEDHWSDVLDFSEDYDEDHVGKVKWFLEKKHLTIQEIDDDYTNNFDEDYSFERAR